MKAQGMPKRGPRATYDEQLLSFIRLTDGKGDDRVWSLPEKGRSRRKRREQRNTMTFEHTEECELRPRPNECLQCWQSQPAEDDE